ncbi:MAG: DUF616 domain-containing protein [Desulfovibrio sp.]|nr:DUF616 domain-containing protein [Desulfovibrio sp.]
MSTPSDSNSVFDALWYAARYLNENDSDKALRHYQQQGRTLGYAASFEEEADRRRKALDQMLCRDLCQPERLRERLAHFHSACQAQAHKPRWVIFSAVAGDYDSLKIPFWLDARFDYVLFADQPQPETGVWQIRPLPYLDYDLTRRTRYVKVHGPRLLQDYDFAIWVDQNVILTADLSEEIEAFFKSGAALGTFFHPTRHTLVSEASACLALGKDEKEALSTQLARYQKLAVSDLVANTNVLFLRLGHPDLERLLHAWWAELVNYSRRDQLSLAYALQVSGCAWQPLARKGLCPANHSKFAVFGHDKNRGICRSLLAMTSPKLTDPLAFSAGSKQEVKKDAWPVEIVVWLRSGERLGQELVASLAATAGNVPRHLFFEDESAREEVLGSLAGQQGLWQCLCVGQKPVQSLLSLCQKQPQRYLVLIQGNFLLPAHWLDTLLGELHRHRGAGLSGPLSNGLGLQSVPKALLDAGWQEPGLDLASINHLLEAWSFAPSAWRVPLLDSRFLALAPGLGQVLAQALLRTGNFSQALFACEDAGFDLLLAPQTYIQRMPPASALEAAPAPQEQGPRLLRARKTLLYHPLLQELRRRLQIIERSQSVSADHTDSMPSGS